MSENAHSAEHESPIKTPKQLIITVILAFVVPILLIVLLSQFITNMRSIDLKSEAMSPDAIAKRLKPVGDLAFADSTPTAAAGGMRSGEEIYKAVCSACHDSGAAGAPKLGNKKEWELRLKDGQKLLIETAIKGMGGMPPRGGAADLSDLDMARAVTFMANKAGAQYKEPEAPAPEKTAAGGAAKTDGKKVYDTTCAACHVAGVAGAPKAGDKAAWAPRLKAGMNALYANALKGKNAMPAKGGNAALSEAEVKAAVDYLAGLAK